MSDKEAIINTSYLYMLSDMLASVQWIYIERLVFSCYYYSYYSVLVTEKARDYPGPAKLSGRPAAPLALSAKPNIHTFSKSFVVTLLGL